MAPLRWLARVAGVLTVVAGLVHAAVGVTVYAWPSVDTLWFYGTGMALLLIGPLTVLAASERAWASLAAVAEVANVLGVVFGVAFGMVSHWQQPQGPMLLALFVAGGLGCIPALKSPRGS